MEMLLKCGVGETAGRFSLALSRTQSVPGWPIIGLYECSRVRKWELQQSESNWNQKYQEGWTRNGYTKKEYALLN